jgi:hypothetical protein
MNTYDDRLSELFISCGVLDDWWGVERGEEMDERGNVKYDSFMCGARHPCILCRVHGMNGWMDRS